MTPLPPAGHPAIETIVPIPILGGRVVGDFIGFAGLSDGADHFAVRIGDPGRRPLLRLHSECVTGDVFGSLRCDCGAQLAAALDALAREGGLLLYLRQEGRGIGLRDKLRAYRLQDAGRDTFTANEQLGHPPDARDYGIAVEMLAALGVAAVTLLSNNPRKAAALRAAGVDVRERDAGTFATAANRSYLLAKRDLAGHRLALD